MRERIKVEFDGWNGTEQTPNFVEINPMLVEGMVKRMRKLGNELLELGASLTNPLTAIKTIWLDNDEEYAVTWELVVKQSTSYLQGFNSDTGEYFYTQGLGL